MLDQWLDQRDPPAAAGDDEPQLGVALPMRLEQRLDLGLELDPLRGQLDRGGRALDPLQVLGLSGIFASAVGVIRPSTDASSVTGIGSRLSNQGPRTDRGP